MVDETELEAIRRRYDGMVGLRNNDGAPSQAEADIRDLLRIIDEAQINEARWDGVDGTDEEPFPNPPDTAPGLRDASYFLKEAAASCFMEHKDEIANVLRDFSDQLLAMAKSKSGPSDSGPIPITDLPDPLGADVRLGS